MNKIQICYDLRNAPKERYDRLESAIKSLGKATHIQMSVWLIETDMTDRQVYQRLRFILSPSEKLMVSNVVTYINDTTTLSQPKPAINISFPSIPSRNRAVNPLRKTY